MKAFLSSLCNKFFQPNWRPLWLFGVAIVVSIFAPEVSAQGIPGLGEFSLSSNFDDSNDTLKSVAEISALAIQIFTFISLFILSLVGDLVGTEFITSPEAMATLRPMWIFVRNLTNIGFVLMLVYLAFSNLFASFAGGNAPSSLWTVKDKLPKIILAVVAVNFSLLGFRLIIDAVNVGSTAIFGIADVQLEAQSATSVNEVLRNRTWNIIATPLNYQHVDQGGKYQLAPDDLTKKPRELCEDDFKRYVTDPETEKDTIFYLKRFEKWDEYDNKVLACTSFFSTINDLFCSTGSTTDNGCFFRIRDDLTENNLISSGDNTAQNLFMSFGVVFMKLERLPSLAADVNSILQVIDNTLFSLILAAAYVVVLLAFFVVLILRVVTLWLGLVFSPVLVAGAIMGFGGGGGPDIGSKIKTMLIVPIKVAAAFAISFVMLSGMIEFRPNGNEGLLEFGAALSNLAIDEYALLWQILTIVVFWQAAKWALKDTDADTVVNGILGGAEKIGGYLARSSTVEAQIFTIRDKKTGEAKGALGLSGVLQAPFAAIQRSQTDKSTKRRAAYQALGILPDNYTNQLQEFKNAITVNTDPADIESKVQSFLNSASITVSTNTGLKKFRDDVKKELESTLPGSYNQRTTDPMSIIHMPKNALNLYDNNNENAIFRRIRI